jgi:hypothetical protein
MPTCHDESTQSEFPAWRQSYAEARIALPSFENRKVIGVVDESATEEAHRQQVIELRCMQVFLRARESDERNFGQLDRADLHILRRQGREGALRSTRAADLQ